MRGRVDLYVLVLLVVLGMLIADLAYLLALIFIL